MQRSVITAAAILALAGSTAWAVEKVDRKGDAATVQRDVRSMFEALLHGKGEVVAKYTHPDIITRMGGPEAAKAAFDGAAAKLERLGIKQESISFPEPPKFLAGKNGRRFALVTTQSVFTGDGQRAKIRSFQLGVKEAGAKDWKYLQGPQVTPQTLAELFPDFPADQKLPSISKEPL